MDFKAHRWLSQTAQFARDHELWSPQSRLVVAVSGGPDSTALCYFARFLMDNHCCASARLIHINHGHRSGLEQDEHFVQKLAQKLDLELDIYRLEGLKDGPNFELQAREYRHHLMDQETVGDELLLSAHHLDDSFEWWLAQSCKSSTLHPLGIPLVNGRWRRPFLCVTKDQILHFLKRVGSAYLDDPTSKETRFERNFLRHSITPHLQERYPQRLRHYARRMNATALELGWHRWSCREEELGLSIEQDQIGGVLLTAQSWQGWARPMISYQLKRVVEQMGTSHRGELADQVQKAVQAVARHKKGPMSLSGGVQVYLFPQALYLLHKDKMNLYRELDQELSQYLKKGAQIPDDLSSQCLVTPYFLNSSKTGGTFKSSLFNEVWKNWPKKAKSLIYAYQAQRMFLDSCSFGR